LRRGVPLLGPPSAARICAVDGCGRAVDIGGLCATHRARLRVHGDPLVGGALA
jgi:hypothetical protein